MKLNKLVLKFVSISFSILVMLLVVIGLIKLGSFCYDFGYRVFTEGPVEEKPGTDVTVDVTGDLSEYQIGKLLKKEGLIRDANLFYVQLRMSAYHGKLKTGTYTLNTSMTAKDMMVVMAAESEESTESTESTEQRTDLDSSDGTSSDDTGADDAGEEGQQKLDPYHTEQAQRDQQHHHGRDAGTRAAHGTGKAVQNAEQEVERTEPPHGQLAVGDHGLVGGEQVQNGVLSGQ